MSEPRTHPYGVAIPDDARDTSTGYIEYPTALRCPVCGEALSTEYPTALRCPVCGEALSTDRAPAGAAVPWHGGPSGVCPGGGKTLAEIGVPEAERASFLAGWMSEGPHPPRLIDPAERVRGAAT
jgi:rubredoxin